MTLTSRGVESSSAVGGRLGSNSAVLLATTALSSVTGFVFWVQVARAYDPSAVGVATALVSATNVIALSALLGYNVFFVQQLPSSPRPSTDLTVGLIAVFGAATVIGLGYLVVWSTLLISSAIAGPGAMTVMAVLIGGTAVNLVTDSVFVGQRRPGFNLLIDGLLMGGLKVVLPLSLVAYGSFGIFVSFTLAAVTAASASVLVLVLRFGFRPSLTGWRTSLTSSRAYLGGNYLASVLNVAPVIALPLLVAHLHSPPQAAVFFISFQIAALVSAVAYATSQSMFAEASRDHEHADVILRRGLVLQLGGVILAATVVASVAQPLLRIFGPLYAEQARPVLMILLLACVAVALSTWSQTVLRVLRRTRALVMANVFGLLGFVGVCAAGLTHSVTWAAAAWAVGNLVTATYAGLSARRGRRAGNTR